MERGSARNGATGSGKILYGCWPSMASETTLLMFRMILAWSAASHLACPGKREGILTDAGLPGKGGPHEDELEELFPFELFWDLLLPLTGISVGALGIQLTLGMSLAEPLILLILPNIRGALRGWHDRLLSWHMGGLFGQPMVLAQLAVARAELKCDGEEAMREGCGTAALGSLVGVYAAGALMGSALRRGIELGYESPHLRYAVVVFLVFSNLHTVVMNGEALGRHHAQHAQAPEASQGRGGPSESKSSSFGLGHPGSSPEETTPLNRILAASSTRTNESQHTFVLGTVNSIFERFGVTRCSEWFFEKSAEALHLLIEELAKILTVAWLSKDIIVARSFMVLGLTIVVGPTPLAKYDFFKGTPLMHGFRVMWFDVANVVTAGIGVPLAVAAPLRLPVSRCLEACYLVAIMACLMAFIACIRARVSLEAFEAAMCAGLVLGVCTAFTNAVLAMRTVKRTAANPSATAVALCWSLLGGSVTQVVGPQFGGFIFQHSRWEGVVLVAGMACMISFFAATRAEDTKRTR